MAKRVVCVLRRPTDAPTVAVAAGTARREGARSRPRSEKGSTSSWRRTGFLAWSALVFLAALDLSRAFSFSTRLLGRTPAGATNAAPAAAATRFASHAFTNPRQPNLNPSRSRPLYYDNDKSGSGDYFSSFDGGNDGGRRRRKKRRRGDDASGEYGVLNARLCEMRRRELEEEYRRPPNPALPPVEFISELLRALWYNSDPLPDSGFRLLLRASTKDWRRRLYDAVAAPDHANEEIVASAVGEAMARPRNQYGILVGEDETYYASFPTDVIDYGDGHCWVECQLRDKTSDQLLAILGWELEQRESDGAWLVSQIDWQDFRDAYRPGIGREEWMRICG